MIDRIERIGRAPIDRSVDRLITPIGLLDRLVRPTGTARIDQIDLIDQINPIN